MKKISICIATYNGEKYIHKQLISILPQLSENDEVIISDDHSSDNTLLVVDQLNDSRINVSLNMSEPGPVSNFEQAIKRATGDYIFLADQDDVWHSNKIRVMQELLKDYDLVLSDCQVVNEHGAIIHKSFFEHRGSKIGFWHNLYKNSYVGCCMAFKKEVLSYILPFPKAIHMHDWWIGLLVEARGKVCFYPYPMINYVRHGENASPTASATGSTYSYIQRFQNRILLVLNVVVRLLYKLR